MSLIILFGLATVRNITIALGSDQFFSLQHLDPFLLNWTILGKIIVGLFLPKMFSLNWTILGQIIVGFFFTKNVLTELDYSRTNYWEQFFDQFFRLITLIKCLKGHKSLRMLCDGPETPTE